MSKTSMTSFGFILNMVSEEDFQTFIRKLTIFATRQPIKYTDLDKSHMKCRGPLNNYYAPNFEKVGDILVLACPCVSVCVCVCGMEISS